MIFLRKKALTRPDFDALAERVGALPKMKRDPNPRYFIVKCLRGPAESRTGQIFFLEAYYEALKSRPELSLAVAAHEFVHIKEGHVDRTGDLRLAGYCFLLMCPMMFLLVLLLWVQWLFVPVMVVIPSVTDVFYAPYWKLGERRRLETHCDLEALHNLANGDLRQAPDDLIHALEASLPFRKKPSWYNPDSHPPLEQRIIDIRVASGSS